MLHETVLAGLRRHWRSRVLYGCVAISMIGVLVAQASRVPAGFAWAGIPLGVWLYQGAFVERRLALNHRAGESTLLSEFGPGTNATLFRGWLLACLAGFLLLPRQPGLLAWIPAVIYTIANVANYLDGYLARTSDHATRMGEALDIEYDALGLLIAVSIAIHFSALPAWYLPVGLARYAFILGLWIRRRADKPIQPLPQSDSRRPLAGLQMGALGIILVPVLQPPVTTLGGVLLALPLLIGFTRDWLVVSGVVDPDSVVYQRARQRVKRVMLHWLPVLLRAAVIAAAVHLGSVGATTSSEPEVGLASSAFSMAGEAGAALRLVGLAAGAAVGLGFVPRISAALFLALLLAHAAAGGSSPTLLMGVTAAVGVLMAGGGAFSAWQPEAGWLGRRAGEKGVVG